MSVITIEKTGATTIVTVTVDGVERQKIAVNRPLDYHKEGDRLVFDNHEELTRLQLAGRTAEFDGSTNTLLGTPTDVITLIDGIAAAKLFAGYDVP